MTPERLQSWIYRPVSGSSTLSLSYEPTLGQSSVVATWTREEVELTRENSGSQGDEVITAARDYMEQLEQREPCKFVLAWYGERRADPLRSTPIKLKPEDSPATALVPSAISAAANSDNALLVNVIFQLLGHIERNQKANNASQGIVLAAYERALNMQQRVNDGQEKTIDHLRALISTQPDTEDGEISGVKARALDKLVQALPAVMNMGVQLATNAASAPPKASREQRMTAARAALENLDPSEIAELVSTDDSTDGGADDAPQH